MLSKNKGEKRIEVGRLRAGVFIRLEGVPWYRHPFLTSSFRIKDAEQVETLKALGVEKVIYVPEKSLTKPFSKVRKTKRFGNFILPGENPVDDELYVEKKQRIEILRKKKEAVSRTEHHYSASVNRIEALMKSINRGSSQFVGEAIDFADELSGYFLKDNESTLHVLNLQESKKSGLYYHSLNATVLSLIIGRALELEKSELHDLALGALLHDIGKSKIEKKVLYKKAMHTKAEHILLSKHPFWGVQLLSKEEDFPPEAMHVVYEHHERCDGKGYPRKLCKDQIHPLSKILAVANTYDVLINRRDPKTSFTPYQALSYLFAKGQKAYDKVVLTAFIRCMGVYPPGTVVVLNKEMVGMVVSVNLAKPLLPSVVVFDRQIPHNEALILDLEVEDEFSITGSLNPSKLEPEVYDYLSPRARITYFVDPDSVKETGS